MVETGWNLDSPPGFRGLHPEEPVTYYKRHLPHWRQHGATYFVTFRQADSLPQTRLRELKLLRIEWERRHPEPRSSELWQELSREVITRVERWLDQGMGSCVLRNGQSRERVVEAVHHFDQDRYELVCYVIMPNHVHAIVRPLTPESQPLERILQSWKAYTAREINATMHLSDAFWQDESFDRIIRDEEHLWRCIQYIGRNPRNARLGPGEYRLWMRPSWEELGWRFESA